MLTKTYETKQEWLADREGKITGSTLKDIVTKRGTGRKIGFWQLVAARMAIPDDGVMSPMERGSAIESMALDAFTVETGIELNTDLVMWISEDNPSMAISPDGFTEDLTVAVECKALSSARHLEALVTQNIPDDYEFQVLQYFIVNESLETLYFVFYDPRVVAKPLFYLEVNRSDLEDQIAQYTEYQVNLLLEIDEIIEKIEFN